MRRPGVVTCLLLAAVVCAACSMRPRGHKDDDDTDAGGGDGDADGDSDGDADCEPAPADATAEQREALRIVNELRLQIGVPCARMVSEINDAAQAHAEYGQSNAGVAGCQSTGHEETDGCTGFTGTQFWERMTTAGYAGGASSEIVHFMGSPAAAIDGWVGTLWHRVPVVAPNTLELGYGTTPGWDVMDFGTGQAADPDGVWFYPYDGAVVSPFGGDEVPAPPDPPAGCAGGFCQWGTFITISFDASAAATIDTHELLGPSGPVEHNWETGGMLGSGYAMVTDPLDGGAEYTVSVSGTLNGSAFDRTISFRTQ